MPPPREIASATTMALTEPAVRQASVVSARVVAPTEMSARALLAKGPRLWTGLLLIAMAAPKGMCTAIVVCAEAMWV
jgi:hypothetical protein